MLQQQKGVTLIEVMIVVIVIAILAAMATVGFSSSVRKTQRVQAQQAMQEVAGKLEQWKAQHYTYTGATLENSRIYGSTQMARNTRHYEGKLTVPDLGTTWELTLTPRLPGQIKDGVLMMNNHGQKCRGSEGSATCALNATSHW